MPFPTSDMPGHTRSRERAGAALDRVVEAPDIDFKESASWTRLKWTIVKTALGMGNLRDGGLVVIGVSERDGTTWQLDGISKVDLNTFDADTMAATFEKFGSPAPAVQAVLHERDGKTYLLLDVAEFEEIPFICKRNGPPDTGLEQGAFYHRPLGGVPRTEKVRSAEDMRTIFQLAAEKGARKILEQSERIGLGGPAMPGPTDDDRYDEELGGL